MVKPFTIRLRLMSFVYAFRGIKFLLKTQHNAWIHLFLTGLSVGLGWWLRLAPSEWALLILAVTLVWAMEALNTAIESVCDAVSPEDHPLIGQAKDVAAGAVLFAAAGAFGVGALLFIPKLFLN